MSQDYRSTRKFNTAWEITNLTGWTEIPSPHPKGICFTDGIGHKVYWWKHCDDGMDFTAFHGDGTNYKFVHLTFAQPLQLVEL